jgi:hypothetical protein
VIFVTAKVVSFERGRECAAMRWIAIVSFFGRAIAIAIAGAGAFVIADYALNWL